MQHYAVPLVEESLHCFTQMLQIVLCWGSLKNLKKKGISISERYILEHWLQIHEVHDAPSFWLVGVRSCHQDFLKPLLVWFGSGDSRPLFALEPQFRTPGTRLSARMLFRQQSSSRAPEDTSKAFRWSVKTLSCKGLFLFFIFLISVWGSLISFGDL